jgi:hypothetical protein
MNRTGRMSEKGYIFIEFLISAVKCFTYVLCDERVANQSGENNPKKVVSCHFRTIYYFNLTSPSYDTSSVCKNIQLLKTEF